MSQNNYSHYFLFFFLASSLLVVYFIIEPFLTPLILASVFAFLFYPIHQKILARTKNNEGLSAFITVIIGVFLVLLPFAFLGTLILKEATDLYQALSENRAQFIAQAGNLLTWLRTLLPFPIHFDLDISQYAKQGLEFLTLSLGAAFSSIAKLLMNMFVFAIAFYFLLKDGKALKNYIVALSPLADADDEMIATRIGQAVTSVVRGGLLLGIIQGTLTGIGFLIFGVPNPVLWGAVAAIAALIPGIGTALVILPAVLFLFFIGNMFGGIGLFIWGVTAVGLIDNILGPRLVGRGMLLHPLAVFLAVLGGIIFFGPIGFLLGPLAMSVCFALITIYFALKAKEAGVTK